MTTQQLAKRLSILDNGELVNLAIANNLPAIIDNASQLTGVLGAQWSEASIRQLLEEFNNRNDVASIRYLLSVPYLPGANISPSDAQAVNLLFYKLSNTPTYRQLKSGAIGGGAAGATNLPSSSAGSGSNFDWSVLISSLASNASDIISSVGNIFNGQPANPILPTQTTPTTTTTTPKDNSMLYLGLGVTALVVVGVIVWLAAKPKKQ
jgi:hypothetical protein